MVKVPTCRSPNCSNEAQNLQKVVQTGDLSITSRAVPSPNCGQVPVTPPSKLTGSLTLVCNGLPESLVPEIPLKPRSVNRQLAKQSVGGATPAVDSLGACTRLDEASSVTMALLVSIDGVGLARGRVNLQDYRVQKGLATVGIDPACILLRNIIPEIAWERTRQLEDEPFDKATLATGILEACFS